MKKFFTQYWIYLAVKTACKTEIFDLIQNGYNTLDKISSKKNFDKNVLADLLNVLENLQLIEQKSFIKLTEQGKFLTENHPNSLKYACILWGEEHMTAWQNFEYTLKTGKPAFDNHFGKNFFEYIEYKPEQIKIYHRAMGEYSRDDYKEICEIIDFSKFKTITDFGGGIGSLISVIAEKNPYSKCYIFDKKELEPHILNGNFEFIAGDFFQKTNHKTDAAIVSRILHDWNDEECDLILKNIRSALNQNGVIFVIEKLFSDKNLSLLNLNMKIMTTGFERSLDNYKKLLQNVGFKFLEVKEMDNLQKILIFQKI